MMRRDLLLGAGCLAALGGAEALRPRRLLSLLGESKLDALIPRRFAGWSVAPGGDVVVPKTPGSLAASLYNETVTRTYANRDGGAQIMLLVAHGDSQSDLLQLHRPESCYRAVGFSVSPPRALSVPLGRGAGVPAVALTARAGPRVEDVLYWTRLGEYLPTTAGEQRRDRLRTAMAGYVADGVLVRVSAIQGQGSADWPRITGFATTLIDAVAANGRAALIGTARARALA